MFRHVFLASFIFTWCLVAGVPTEYGLLGGTITFKTESTTLISEILWKHNGNKAVEFDGNEEHVFNSFKDRITLDWVSAELSISDLRYEDSGTYILEAYSNNELKRSSYTLNVIGNVPKPKISCQMNKDTDKSGHQAKLTCSTEPSESSMKIEWTSHGQSGPELPIVLGPEKDEEVYSCTVSNPLTKDSATFTAKDCYGKGSTAQTVGIILGILLAIALCISSAFVFVWWKRKHGAEIPSDEEKGALEAGDSESHRPLIHRSSTRPSDQRLDRLNREREDTESVQDNQKGDEINDELPPKDVEHHDDEVKTIPPPVPNNGHSHVDPHNNEDLENKNSVKTTSVLSNQTEDTQHQTADDPQSHTASEQPEVENQADKVKKTPPPVAKKRQSVHRPENERADSVKETDEQTEDTQQQKADDLQSHTASEQPDVENQDDKTTKTPPPVAKKPHFLIKKNEPPEPMKDNNVLSNEQTEDTQHQMADNLQSHTASEQPEVENQADKVKKTPPPVAKKRQSVHRPKNERADSVKETDEQTEDTQQQIADDLQSRTASEQPEVENQADKVKKTPPPVAKKRHSQMHHHKNEPPEEVKTEDTQHHTADDPQSHTASEQPDVKNQDDKAQKIPPPVSKKPHLDGHPHNNKGLENETQKPHTASEQPDKKAEEDKKEEEDANPEANVREPELGEGNKLDNLSTAQEDKEEEKNVGVDTAQPHSPVTSKLDNTTNQ